MVFLQLVLAGLAEGGPLVDFDIAIGAVALVAVGVLVLVLAFELGPPDPRLAGLVVADGHLQGVGAEVGAVQFVLRQPLERLGHIPVGDAFGLLDRLALGDLGQHARDGDRRAAAEGLELDVFDPLVADLEVDGHHVPAEGIADLAHPVRLLDHPDIAGIAEMIHHDLIVHHRDLLLGFSILPKRKHPPNHGRPIRAGRSILPFGRRLQPRSAV